MNHHSSVNAPSEPGEVLARWIAGLSQPGESCSPCLAQGSALNAILLCTQCEITGDDQHLVAAAEHLLHAGTMLEDAPLTSAFHQGITGIGWSLQIFPAPELVPWRCGLLKDIDEALSNGLMGRRFVNLDIINGLAGIVVYALARGRSEPSSAQLWQCIDTHISDLLSRWNSAPVSELTKSKSLSNLGVAHGIPGVVSVAAEAVHHGHLKKSSKALVLESLDKLWEMRLPQSSAGANFPYTIEGRAIARLAWCYGNLGLAAVFNNGAKLSSKYSFHVNELAKAALLQYESDHSGVRDASLCHGESGVVVAFDHLSRSESIISTVAKDLASSARIAYAAAREYEVIENGCSVFLHQTPKGAIPSASFLEGGAGVSLALSSFGTSYRRDWLGALSYF